ncbi:MAG: sigma-70 family RNA polymerase sigma factor [Firmicutes bacterium]|nr:sigma-70 family RNA polymerase sigma factor [Bacillota bacterium]
MEREKPDLSRLADEVLAAMAAAGDETAADELLSRYKDVVRVKSKLYYMLGADREDVVQEGMIGLFGAIHSYDPSKGAAFRTFADLCISRRILSAVKGAARKKNAPLNEALSLDKPASEEQGGQTIGDVLPAGTDSNPEDAVILAELSKLVTDKDSKLLSPFEHRVLKSLYEGKGYRQIAEELQVPAKSVDNAIQRIRKKLKVFFES